MIEFPLILLGYTLVPFIAIRLMLMVDRRHLTCVESAFPQVEIL